MPEPTDPTVTIDVTTPPGVDVVVTGADDEDAPDDGQDEPETGADEVTDTP